MPEPWLLVCGLLVRLRLTEMLLRVLVWVKGVGLRRRKR
jgi:hypothetical protein